MTKWKMIGIRVPEESDLPARLKEISEKTRLPYYELLEKLIAQAELEISTPVPGFEAKDTIALQALVENFSDLKLQVHEIGARLKVLEKAANPSQASETSVAASHKRAQQNDRSDSDKIEDSELTEPITVAIRPERPGESAKQPGGAEVPEEIEVKSESEEKATTITYIRRLSVEGLSLRKIAERLKSEEIPTLSGTGVWHHGTVRKVLASAQTS